MHEPSCEKTTRRAHSTFCCVNKQHQMVILRGNCMILFKMAQDYLNSSSYLGLSKAFTGNQYQLLVIISLTGRTKAQFRRGWTIKNRSRWVPKIITAEQLISGPVASIWCASSSISHPRKVPLHPVTNICHWSCSSLNKLHQFIKYKPIEARPADSCCNLYFT